LEFRRVLCRSAGVPIPDLALVLAAPGRGRGGRGGLAILERVEDLGGQRALEAAVLVFAHGVDGALGDVAQLGGDELVIGLHGEPLRVEGDAVDDLIRVSVDGHRQPSFRVMWSEGVVLSRDGGNLSYG